MKKLFTIAIALMTVFSLSVPAFAVIYTADTTIRERDQLGNDVKTVYGTIAFDSDYPCDNSVGGTSRCGEDLIPTQIGMTTLTHMYIEGEHVDLAGTFFLFDYDATYFTGSGGTGGIRANVSSNRSPDIVAAGASLPSVATYDLSALSAVPFMAIGT